MIPWTSLKAIVADHPYYSNATYVSVLVNCFDQLSVCFYHPQIHGINYHISVYVCYNLLFDVIRAISFIYKFAILLPSFILALFNRKYIARRNYVDNSMELTICLFLNTIALSVLAVSNFAFPYYPDVLDGLYDICLFLGATSFLTCIIFLPTVLKWRNNVSMCTIITCMLFVMVIVHACREEYIQ